MWLNYLPMQILRVIMMTINNKNKKMSEARTSVCLFSILPVALENHMKVTLGHCLRSRQASGRFGQRIFKKNWG